MHINKDTLKFHMKKCGMTQTELAAVSKVSAKTIGRALRENRSQNEDTVGNLAMALQVEPAALGLPPDVVSEMAALEQMARTYRHSLTLAGEERLNFDLVQRHYGVSNDLIIKAAPLMFSLVAELCLAERREAFQRACDWESNIPPHLRNASGVAVGHMDGVLARERESIDRSDILGRHLVDTLDDYAVRFAPIPFHDFLCRFAEQTNAEAFENVEIDRRGIYFSLFGQDLETIANSDSAAKLSLQNGRVRIRDIPEELLATNKASERADWLKQHLTDEDRYELDLRASIIAGLNANEGAK